MLPEPLCGALTFAFGVPRSNLLRSIQLALGVDLELLQLVVGSQLFPDRRRTIAGPAEIHALRL